uniref:RNA-directed DNA polymerase n=1 Tax=Trichogramma kaykai TaxID=54128 RepID=A0ABD2WYB9_9HYME
MYFDNVKVCQVEFDNRASKPQSISAIGLQDATAEEKAELEKIVACTLPDLGPDAPLGCTDWAEHEIEAACEKPIKQRCYPVSQRMEEIMYGQLENMLKQGTVTPSTSSWSSPIVMVKKANGEYRFCVDYRKLNAVTKISARPMPHMDSILRKLRAAKYITTLDLSQAYFQVPIKKELRHLTAFTVPGRGLYEFKKMAFGLAGAPATFQTLMDKIISPKLEPHAFAYLDDIIIATETFEQHKEVLKEVLSRLTQAGLTINKEKSHFCCREVRYLGVLVDRDGYRPDPTKIEPIVSFPTPRTLKQLRSFLGAASWYRKFIEKFATIAEPLVKLTRKNIKFTWTEEQEKAFSRMKAMIASVPMLARPISGNDVFVVQTDASSTGLGAVLTQRINNEEKVLEFASRTMSPAERNYSVTERECLAVIWAIRKFRPYIEGYKFKVITDHQSLKWLQKLQNPIGRLARWSLELQEYDITVEYRPRALNHVPDALSRMHEQPQDEIAATQEKPQNNDPWYDRMYTAVQQQANAYPDWKIVGKKLYRYKPSRDDDEQMGEGEAWKLVLPKEKRAEALYEGHDELTSGHLGSRKTYRRIATLYFWPNMQKDVNEYVKNCLICQQCKVEQFAPGGLMGRRQITQPWEMVAADITGPFPRSSAGNRYLLIFMDMFTRYVESIPIQKANGAMISQRLYSRIFMRFGVPDVLLTDNGTEFCNDLMTEFLEKSGVKQFLICPYNPRANPVERINRTYKTMIVCYLEKDHTKWDENVAELTFAYNTAIQETTGASPAFLNFGRQPKIADNLRRREEEERNKNLDLVAKEEWKSHLNKLHDHYAVINKRIAIAQDRQAKYFNEKHREVEFKVGDKVWLKNRVQSSAPNNIAAKLTPRNGGPFTIAEKVGSVVYELVDDAGESVGQSHVRYLRPLVQPIEDTEETDSENEIQTTNPEAQTHDAGVDHANTNRKEANEAETHEATSELANNEKMNEVSDKAQLHVTAHEQAEPHKSTGNEARARDKKAEATEPSSGKGSIKPDKTQKVKKAKRKNTLIVKRTDSRNKGRKKPMTTRGLEQHANKKHTNSPDEQEEPSDVPEYENQTSRRTTRAAARRKE